MPVITTPDGWIGEPVSQFCVARDSVDEEEDWHPSIVAKRHGKINLLWMEDAVTRNMVGWWSDRCGHGK